MKQYKFSLDKSSKKHVCPNPDCNKRTFVRYIDTETNSYLPETFGRCDRETNCGYHRSPPKGKTGYLIAFLSLQAISSIAYKLTDLNGVIHSVPKSQILEINNGCCWVAEWFLKNSKINFLGCESKNFNSGNFDFVNEVKIIKTPPPEPSFHDYSLISKSGRNFKENNFVQFLKTIFTNDEVKNAILKYKIGTSKHWNGATVFWQIDNNEKVRHGKIMLFNPETGKRLKRPDGKAFISSVRSVLKLDDFIINQCLFGLHLINESNQKTVAVVESEKTAVIMSIFKPQYIWVATGMKGGFKHENLKPIKDYKIIAFPDKSEYNDWLNKAIELNATGFKIVVNDWLEQTDYEAGTDFADVFINEVKNTTPEPQIIYTDAETIVHKIEQHTPEIRLLIETFDLTDTKGNEIRKAV